MMERQLDNTVEEEDTEPIIQHQLEEWTQLQQTICDFSRDLKPQDIVSRKVLAINFMTALASRDNSFKLASRGLIQPLKSSLKKNARIRIPSRRLMKTQCVFCIENERLSYEERTRTFRRVSHMVDHVESVSNQRSRG